MLGDQVSSLDAVAQELQDFQPGKSLFLFIDFRYHSVLVDNLIFSEQSMVIEGVHDFSFKLLY